MQYIIVFQDNGLPHRRASAFSSILRNSAELRAQCGLSECGQ